MDQSKDQPKTPTLEEIQAQFPGLTAEEFAHRLGFTSMEAFRFWQRGRTSLSGEATPDLVRRAPGEIPPTGKAPADQAIPVDAAGVVLLLCGDLPAVRLPGAVDWTVNRDQDELRIYGVRNGSRVLMASYRWSIVAEIRRMREGD